MGRKLLILRGSLRSHLGMTVPPAAPRRSRRAHRSARRGIVPFLEIDFWAWRGPGSRRDAGQAPLIAGCELLGALGCADQRAQRADHRQDAGDVALVEDMD